MSECARCHRLVSEPNTAYGYAGEFCGCATLPPGSLYIRELIAIHERDPHRAEVLKRARERINAMLGDK